MKNQKSKEMLLNVCTGITCINIGIAMAYVSFTGISLNSIKSLTKIRLADSYTVSIETDENGDKEINMEFNHPYSIADYFTTYNSYLSQGDKSLVNVIKCTDGSISRYELYDYLDEYFENENIDIKLISVSPDNVPTYAIYK